MTGPPAPGQRARARRAWIERRADLLIPTALDRYRAQLLYLAVGAWNTVFGYGVFAALYYIAGSRLGAVPVIAASYVVAVMGAYLGYRYVAFRSYQSVLAEFPRFSIVYIVTLAANLIFYPIALRLLPLNVYAIQAVFTIGVVVASYFAHRRFSFRARARIRVEAQPSDRRTEGAGHVADQGPLPGGK